MISERKEGLFMLLQDVLKEFLFDCRMRKLSERTLKGYKNNNLSLFRYLENEYDIVKLDEVHYKLIQAYIKFLMDKELKETYINGLIKCFRAFLSIVMLKNILVRCKNMVYGYCRIFI